MGETQTPMAMGATMVASSAGDLVNPSASSSGASLPAPEVEPRAYVSDLAGTVLLERYRIIERLGAGGMGVVYLAEHVTIKKRCAIKVLSDEYANKPDIVDRFLQEARAASMIAHENVVEITDYGQTPSGSVFFVMEMLAGEDLAETIHREGALPWSRVQPIILQICRALREAHNAGIIHRDMKPENCFRVERNATKDFIKVLDFGIAKVTTEEGEGKGLTKTGMIFGTPEYMSPEQAQGMRVDHRADIYAVGVIMYELLTGKVPFTADTFMGVLTKHMFEVPPAPSAVAPEGVTIARPVEALILKALQKDRDHRFGSMDEMMAAIEGVGRGEAVAVVSERIDRPRSGPLLAFSGDEGEVARSGSSAWIAITVAVLVVAGLGAYWLAVGDGDGDENDPVALVEPKPSEPAPIVEAPQPPVVPVEADPGVVRLLLTTNVEAEVFDPEGGVVLGTTNTEGGIAVARSATPRMLTLRADGYVDHPIEVVLEGDFDHTFELDPISKGKKGKGKKGKGKSPKGGTGGGSGDSGGAGDSGGKGGPLGLKDPFGGVGK